MNRHRTAPAAAAGEPVRHVAMLGWLAAVALLSGCSALLDKPAFRMQLPTSIPATGAEAVDSGSADDASSADQSLAIAVIGDLQMTSGFVRLVRSREDNEKAQQTLVDDLQSRTDSLSALVIVGDLVYTARSRSDWAHFDSLVTPIAGHVPVLPAIGNHDYYCIFMQLCWQSVVPKPLRRRFPWMEPGEPYSIGSGELLLVFLDSETELERQGTWLRERLASAAGQFSAALVFFHRPPYTNSIDRGAVGDLGVLESIVPVVRSAPLTTIVVNGHIHGYEHLVVDGVHYITTAGGGGPRGPLGSEQPGNVYAGRECLREDGVVLRPFNYLLIRDRGSAIAVDVLGLCRANEPVELLESFSVPKSAPSR